MVVFEFNMFGSSIKFNSSIHFNAGLVVFMDLAKKKLGFCIRSRNNLFISSIIFIRGKTLRMVDDNAMYSASDIISEISVCNVMHQ